MLKSSPTPILTTKLMPLFQRISRSRKKINSRLLNQAEFEICFPPDDDEINQLNFQSQKDTDQQTNQSQPETTISARFDVSSNPRQTVSNGHRPMKNSVALDFNQIQPRSTFNAENRLEKQENQGYLWVETDQNDVIFLPNNTEIEFRSSINGMNNTTETENEHVVSSPITPNLAPVDRTNTSQIESDIEETRAAVQCASVRPVASNDQLDTQSFMDSSSSTNSSNNDNSLTREARANLDDESYIQQQGTNLQRIRHLEVLLRSEYERADSDLAMQNYDEPSIEEKYEKVLAVNKALLSELKELKDAKNRIDSPWRCESCTFINNAYRITRKDVCEMCEAPSPKKKHELLHR